MSKCPTCHSPAPHLHPAIQHEGEVQVCADPFHDRVTPEQPRGRASESTAEWNLQAAITLTQTREALHTLCEAVDDYLNWQGNIDHVFGAMQMARAVLREK